MADYATVQDIIDRYGQLTTEEISRAQTLIPDVCARLRQEADYRGYDLDAMAAASENYALVLKSVTCDIVERQLKTPVVTSDIGPMTQLTQSAGGYSATGTLLNPGGGIFIKRSELSALGLRRQRYGVVEIYADPWNNDNPI